MPSRRIRALLLIVLGLSILLVAATGRTSVEPGRAAPVDPPSATPLPPRAAEPAPASATPTAIPSAIPSATASPTPAPFFVGRHLGSRANCNRTVVFGALYDGLGRTINRVRVRVWWPDAPPDQLLSDPSGSRAGLAEGEYEVVIDDRPRDGWWLVAVVDDAGDLLSEAVVVETTGGGCEDGSGRQMVRVDFRLASGHAGTIGSTVTPTPLPTATVPPAPPPPPPAATPEPPPVAPTPDGQSRVIKVPILMYHYISVPPPGSDRVRRDLSVGPDIFRAHLITLREQGYTSITLVELLRAIQQGTPLPPKPIVLTFDDGYRDAYENAFPILREEGFVGTFFITTDLVEERNVNYLTWEQVVEMHQAGMEIASHTESHASLPGLPLLTVWQELVGSRQLIEHRLGTEVRVFAYPYGDFDPGVAHLAHAAGYWIGVSTKQGVTHGNGNLLTLRRIRVHGGEFPETVMERIHYWMHEAQSEP